MQMKLAFVCANLHSTLSNSERVKMKKVLFILALFSISNICGTVADILSEDPWRVLEYKFVIKPQKKANTLKNFAIKGASALGGGVGSWGFYGLVHSYLFNHPFRWKYIPSTAMSTSQKLLSYAIFPVSLISGIVAYSLANQLLVRKFQKEELFDLLKNWEKYKSHIPATLISKLNEVKQEYLTNKAHLEEQVDEINEVIVSQINLHFYGDPKAKNFFDIRTLSANFNTHFVFDIAKIIKSLVDAFAVYNRAEPDLKS